MLSNFSSWPTYLLAESGLLGTWLITVLNEPGSDLHTLITNASLKALVLLEAGLLVAIGAHARATVSGADIQSPPPAPRVELETAHHGEAGVR